MTVEQLIRLLSEFDQSKTIAVSCEGGCVEDDQFTLVEKDDKLIIEV